MNIERARDIANIAYQISKCESYLSSLKGHSYEDEYEIYYRGGQVCDLETEALHIIIEHYENKLKTLREKLSKM